MYIETNHLYFQQGAVALMYEKANAKLRKFKATCLSE